MPTPRHPTTRRGVVAALGFGGLGLYGLWAAYGAAPGPAALLGLGHGEARHGGGHAGHGAPAGPSAEEFRRLSERFVARYRLEDGSVHPRRLVDRPAPDAHAGHGAAAAVGPADADAPLEVYLLAARWYYEPAHLRLDAGVPYRFRMMATDVAHGASIQLGRGARMIRLRPDRAVEMDLTFLRPGSHLVYCTVYCGPPHDVMQARIDVA